MLLSPIRLSSQSVLLPYVCAVLVGRLSHKMAKRMATVAGVAQCMISGGIVTIHFVSAALASLRISILIVR